MKQTHTHNKAKNNIVDTVHTAYRGGVDMPTTYPLHNYMNLFDGKAWEKTGSRSINDQE